MCASHPTVFYLNIIHVHRYYLVLLMSRTVWDDGTLRYMGVFVNPWLTVIVVPVCVPRL